MQRSHWPINYHTCFVILHNQHENSVIDNIYKVVKSRFINSTHNIMCFLFLLTHCFVWDNCSPLTKASKLFVKRLKTLDSQMNRIRVNFLRKYSLLSIVSTSRVCPQLRLRYFNHSDIYVIMNSFLKSLSNLSRSTGISTEQKRPCNTETS